MSVGHTPGPWDWDAGIIPPDGPGKYADIYVLDEDMEPIILAEFNDNLPEGRANGRLMATAPELLAPAPDAADLLEQYAAFIRDDVREADLERHPYLPEIERVAADLRAAIAKAIDGELLS